MYQYTTPTITLHLDGIDFSDVASFRVAIESCDLELLKVIDADDPAIDADEQTVTIALTQEETAGLGKGYAVFQVRVVLDDGNVFATNKVRRGIDSVLDEVVVE